MPAIRVVMPDGTTKSFREGTTRAEIARASREMIEAMNGEEGHSAYRAARNTVVTGTPGKPKDMEQPHSSGIFGGWADDARKMVDSVTSTLGGVTHSLRDSYNAKVQDNASKNIRAAIDANGLE